MTNYAHGHEAQQRATVYLESHSWTTRDMNWRTVWCEIDVVAQIATQVCFSKQNIESATLTGQG